MRAHSPYYQMHRTLLDHFPHLRPAHAHGLALWVYGAVLAQSACESAVLAALAPLGKRETTRQRLRLTSGHNSPCHRMTEDCRHPGR